MNERLCRLDIIQTDAGWGWAFFGKNRKQISRSSEVYNKRSSVILSAELGSPVSYVLEGLTGGRPAERYDYLEQVWEEVQVREVDKRGQAGEVPSVGSQP